MQKSIRSVLCGCLALSALTYPLCGCSQRDTPPATPVDTAKTPTFRSSANSYDQPNSPLYTQPGVDHGAAVTLPAIKRVDRYDQNSPLAGAVVSQLQSGIGLDQSRYLAVQTKPDGSVLIEGAIASADLAAKAEKIAKATPGVKSVVNKITVQAP